MDNDEARIRDDERARILDGLSDIGMDRTAVARVICYPLMPTHTQVTAWLTSHGWDRAPAGPGGALWGKGTHAVGVVHEFSDEDAAWGAIQRVARAENLGLGTVLLQMRGLPDA